MNNKIQNAWNWVKDHKVEIGIGTLCLATAVTGVVVFKKQIDPDVVMKRIKNTNEPKKVSFWPKMLGACDLGVGECTDALAYENGSVELWLDDVSLNDMGELGEAIRDHFPDLGDGNVWALLNVRPNTESEG